MVTLFAQKREERTVKEAVCEKGGNNEEKNRCQEFMKHVSETGNRLKKSNRRIIKKRQQT